jgi:hypothetical protein
MSVSRLPPSVYCIPAPFFDSSAPVALTGAIESPALKQPLRAAEEAPKKDVSRG